VLEITPQPNDNLPYPQKTHVTTSVAINQPPSRPAAGLATAIAGLRSTDPRNTVITAPATPSTPVRPQPAIVRPAAARKPPVSRAPVSQMNSRRQPADTFGHRRPPAAAGANVNICICIAHQSVSISYTEPLILSTVAKHYHAVIYSSSTSKFVLQQINRTQHHITGYII